MSRLCHKSVTNIANLKYHIPTKQARRSKVNAQTADSEEQQPLIQPLY